MKVISYLGLVLSLLIHVQAIGQYDATPQQIDSLKNLLENTKRDTTHTSILTNLWRAHIDNNIDSAFMYAGEIIKLGKDLNHVPAEYTGYQRMGIAYSYTDDYETSNKYYRKGLKLSIDKQDYSCIAVMHLNIATNHNILNQEDSTIYHAKQAIPAFLKWNDSLGYAGCQSLISNVYFTKGQYRLSLEYAIEAMNTYHKYDHYRARKGEVSMMTKIARNYLKMQDTLLAIDYLNKGLAIHKEQNDKHGLLYNLFLIGQINSDNTNNSEEAKRMLLESESIAKEMKNPSGLIMANYGLGYYYKKQKNYNEAKKRLKRSLALADSLKQKANIIDNQILLSEIAITEKNYNKAIYIANEVLELAKNKEFLENQVKAFKILSQANEQSGNKEQALVNHKLFKKYNDSIYNINNGQRMAELQTIYETEKKEAEIALQEEEIKTLNEKAKNDKLTKGLYAGGAISGLALSGLLFFGFRQRMKKNKVEREKQEEILKKEIEHKQKELTSQTLHLVQKNTFIQELMENLENVKNSPDKFKTEFRRIVMLLKKENASDKDWEVFKTYFAEVHNDFDQKLKTLSSDISEKEIRLAAFLRMNLTTKEIAATLNVLPDSILKSKYRLKKKLGLKKETDLTGFLNTL
ncbi:tetratricopeptide repeat protein [Croceitalea rosinachiae]|uniref:Tetratricopeptide repeat protein n=1 Tax=Croceitalea rosinachiae TaxID=3075596 RepID=A0ABU3ABV2_9FLAO|nr:tetratricopeptide repeat protein [Croceitalea sp. F388]MDT0607654.1 tetratricopeptide repeat protein [Croceitalea sp. F388]